MRIFDLLIFTTDYIAPVSFFVALRIVKARAQSNARNYLVGGNPLNIKPLAFHVASRYGYLSHLHYKIVQLVCEAISGYCVISA